MEEDIKKCEALLGSERWVLGTQDKKALENLIKAYKELEEENTSKQKAYDDCYCEFKHYKQYESIPVSLVEEKIEELNKEEQELQNSISDEEREEYSDANISYQLMDIEIRRSVLQELLEKR